WSHQEIATWLPPSTVELLGNGTAINCQGIGLPYEGISLEGMGLLEAAAFAIHLGPGIGKVDLNVLNTRTRRDQHFPFPTAFQSSEHLVLYLHIPGKVEFASLEDSPRCRRGIATALQLYRVKEGPVGHVVLCIHLVQHHVTGLEFPNLVWSCPHRLEVVWCIACLLPLVRRKQMLWQDMSTVAKERIIPKGRGFFKDDFDCVLIKLVDMIDVSVTACGRGSSGRICRKFPGKDDIIGRKGFAIMPHHVLFEPPGDRLAILRQPAIVQTRNICGQDRDKV